MQKAFILNNELLPMALKRNMTSTEITEFIDNELLPQARLEIENWIKPRKKQGGYFVVVRQVLCMVDFLGASYAGYPLSERKSDPDGRKIATSAKAKKFILTFFEPKTTYQTDVVTKLYDMYRNGLVHLYQPKILKLNSRDKLLWFFYKGKSKRSRITMDTPKGQIVFRDVNHLKIIRRDSKPHLYYLAVCLDSLYADFEAAVIRYRDKLATTKSLRTRWNTAVSAICKPR